jgi:hypothetical protein
MSDTQTSTVVSAPVDLTATTTELVLVAQDPTFDEFFGNHPVGSNKKIVWLDLVNEGAEIQIKVTFFWQGGVPVFVRCTHNHNAKEQYVGCIDLFNKTMWDAPYSLNATNLEFRMIRHFIVRFSQGKQNKCGFKKVSFK